MISLKLRIAQQRQMFFSPWPAAISAAAKSPPRCGEFGDGRAMWMTAPLRIQAASAQPWHHPVVSSSAAPLRRAGFGN